MLENENPMENLEARIGRILCIPSLELDGNAYKGKYELNNRKSITDFIKCLRLNSKGENVSYANLDTGKKIIISKRSAEKLASHNGEIYQKTIAHIPKIIENMIFLEEMLSDKPNAKYKNYSYYITQVKIDNESYTILSTVGRYGDEIYYDQNIFKGSTQDVFIEAKNKLNEPKYSRLNEILHKTKMGSWPLAEIIPSESPTYPINKYSKFPKKSKI